ncbi:uncharacterized protein BKA78DRAFT_105310 [Phyllosticta capitalensis]|uniref:Uncharacterized protein n=1 Tax=Phyllosticta capitalensis TaxID=121624 RepID=A0ABR1YTG7_9PEZI
MWLLGLPPASAWLWLWPWPWQSRRKEQCVMMRPWARGKRCFFCSACPWFEIPNGKEGKERGGRHRRRGSYANSAEAAAGARGGAASGGEYCSRRSKRDKAVVDEDSWQGGREALRLAAVMSKGKSNALWHHEEGSSDSSSSWGKGFCMILSSRARRLTID